MTNEIERIVERVGRLYPAVYRRFHVSRQDIAGVGVTPRMLAVLQHLSASGPLTPGELAQHLGTSKATASELIDRLEHRGLALRMRDERDLRRILLWLTPQGTTLAERHAEVLGNEPLRDAIARMTPGDRRSLVRGLEALLHAGGVSTEESGRAMNQSCESCGLPMRSAADHAGSDPESRYCSYCSKPDGTLQDFEERFERMVQWAVRKDGLPRGAAEQKTRAYMRTMPLWRAHPALAE